MSSTPFLETAETAETAETGEGIVMTFIDPVFLEIFASKIRPGNNITRFFQRMNSVSEQRASEVRCAELRKFPTTHKHISFAIDRSLRIQSALRSNGHLRSNTVSYPEQLLIDRFRALPDARNVIAKCFKSAAIQVCDDLPRIVCLSKRRPRRVVFQRRTCINDRAQKNLHDGSCFSLTALARSQRPSMVISVLGCPSTMRTIDFGLAKTLAGAVEIPVAARVSCG